MFWYSLLFGNRVVVPVHVILIFSLYDYRQASIWRDNILKWLPVYMPSLAHAWVKCYCAESRVQECVKFRGCHLDTTLFIGEKHIGWGCQPSFNHPAGASALRLLNSTCNEVKSTPLFIPSIHSRPQKQVALYVWITGAHRIQVGFWNEGRTVAKWRLNNLPDGSLNKSETEWTRAKPSLWGEVHSSLLCPRCRGGLVVMMAWLSGRRGDLLAEHKPLLQTNNVQ